ncbi:hypothetical protein ZWY2020_023711 [Hordeum vulgare]|nr:hypothetical protein ZWY2020_023711 [Hordeum vulgare]
MYASSVFAEPMMDVCNAVAMTAQTRAASISLEDFLSKACSSISTTLNSFAKCGTHHASKPNQNERATPSPSVRPAISLAITSSPLTGGSISSVSAMDPAVLFFLGLAARAPLLLLAAQTLGGYSMAKPSTIWINNDGFFESHNRYSRDIVAIAQSQAHSGIASDIAAGFFCVSSSMFPCEKFLFAVSIAAPIDTISSIHSSQIVWSANQACPVRENATLEFTSGGNLVLRDADGSHVWSSNSSDRSVARMVITKFGNLVLINHMNAIVWQSFDHPTDTLLLGQSLVKGLTFHSGGGGGGGGG